MLCLRRFLWVSRPSMLVMGPTRCHSRGSLRGMIVDDHLYDESILSLLQTTATDVSSVRSNSDMRDPTLPARPGSFLVEAGQHATSFPCTGKSPPQTALQCQHVYSSPRFGTRGELRAQTGSENAATRSRSRSTSTLYRDNGSSNCQQRRFRLLPVSREL